MNPVTRLAATMVILGVVAWAGRHTPSDAAAPAAAVQCELDPPGDPAGLEQCVERFPRNVELLVDLGDAYRAAGRAADAIAVYQRARDIDPRDAEVLQRLAR